MKYVIYRCVMYPEDRVLVAYVPKLSDFDLIRRQGWYRIPQKSAPKGRFFMNHSYSRTILLVSPAVGRVKKF